MTKTPKKSIIIAITYSIPQSIGDVHLTFKAHFSPGFPQVGRGRFWSRPLIIEQELEKWDALIAAWLPGTEGQGVADVLFGDYNPTGKLPHSWPRTMSQIPINVGDSDYDPLFPYGFGLSY
jgi:hypothetical protein